MKSLKSNLVALTLAFGVALAGPVSAEYPDAFSQAELDQMLAPVALYPDTVLSHVLIAATYPLEVVQAARWSRHNPSLRGEEAVAAVDRMDWDPSVKALVAFPELLARLDEDLEWTQRLGDAFLMQEEQVVDTIQYLRSEAYAHGHLRSNEHVRVVRETQYIYIEPARTRVVYVPYYDPRVVYVRWRWASHPPVYWGHPPGYRSRVVFYWGPAYHVPPAFFFSSFHWSRRQVVSVHHHHHVHVHHHRHRHTHRHFSSGREIARHDSARHWQHNPKHRRGVSYRPGVNEQRFVQTQREANRRSDTRVINNDTVRTRNQQRQWADRQRSEATISQRAQARTQTREAGTQARTQGSQRHAGDRATEPAQRSQAARTASPRSDASASRAAVQRSTAPAQTRGESTAPARSGQRHADVQARISQSRTQATTPGRESARPAPQGGQHQATTPSRSQATERSPTRSAPSRQAAPRVSQPASQPRTTGATPRQAQPARSPQRQSVAPRGSAPAASLSGSRSSAPASSAPRSTPRSSTPSRSSSAPQSTPRSSAPSRSSSTTRSSTRQSRQID